MIDFDTFILYIITLFDEFCQTKNCHSELRLTSCRAEFRVTITHYDGVCVLAAVVHPTSCRACSLLITHCIYYFLFDLHKHIHNGRIKVCAASVLDNGETFVNRHRISIAAFLRNSIKYISDSHNA